MDDCIFCKIVKGIVPAHKVYEDANFLAFLDINPRSPGHTLVIPKQHYRFVWDVPNAGEYFEVAKKIALAERVAFNAEYVHGKIAGEDVPHAHIWVYPTEKTLGEAKDFVRNAQNIINNL